MPEWIFNGVKIWSMRNYAGLTQAQAAEKAGISQAAVSRLEKGKGSLKALGKLSRAIGCHPGVFWTERGTTESPFDKQKKADIMQNMNNDG